MVKEESGKSTTDIGSSSVSGSSQSSFNRRVGSGLIIPYSSTDSNDDSSKGVNDCDSKQPSGVDFPSAGNPRLQSFRLVPLEFTQDIAKSLTKKMSLLLNELGMPENPLPTRAVCDLVDVIRKETVTLLSIQNALLKKEMEISYLKSATKTQIDDYAAISNKKIANNASSSATSSNNVSYAMPLLITSSDTELVIPQSMLTNSEYIAAPAPPLVKEKAPAAANTKKTTSTGKRKSFEPSSEAAVEASSGASILDGGHIKNTSLQPAPKKSKKSSSQTSEFSISSK